MYKRFVIYDDAANYVVASESKFRLGDEYRKHRMFSKDSPADALRKLADAIEEEGIE